MFRPYPGDVLVASRFMGYGGTSLVTSSQPLPLSSLVFVGHPSGYSVVGLSIRLEGSAAGGAAGGGDDECDVFRRPPMDLVLFAWW